MLLFLLACAPESDAPDEVAPTPARAPDPFAFVVFADPHIAREQDHEDRLEAAVSWVNQHREERGIDLVMVVGDIGWTQNGLDQSKLLLDGLDVPYVPVLGDNEVHANSEELFDQVFTPQFEWLSDQLDDFQRQPSEVYNPEVDETSWIQNVSFRHHGVRFLGLDWVSRDHRAYYGELASLNDFEGGTWPFFEDELSGLDATQVEDVLLFSHHPMTVLPGAMDIEQMDRVSGVTSPIAGRVAAAFAGHMHYTEDRPAGPSGFSVHVTDATWDDENTIRVVDVVWDGDAYQYEHELVIVP